MPTISDFFLMKRESQHLKKAKRLCALSLSFLATLAIHSLPLSAASLLETINVGKNPGPIVSNPAAHLIYVVDQSSNNVAVLDSERLIVKKLIAVGKAPIAIAANPVANMVYVANSAAGTITAISGMQVAGTWPVGGKPIALVVDSVLNKVFIADGLQNQIEVLDGSKGTLLGTVQTGQPTALTLNIATHDLWVACTGPSGSVVVIDGTTNGILTTISGASIPVGIGSISVDPVTNVALIASPTGPVASAIAAIDGDNNYAVTDQPGKAAGAPYATAYDPGGWFFLADNTDNALQYAPGDGILYFGYDIEAIGMTAMAVNAATNQAGAVIPAGQTLILVDLTDPIDTIYLHTLTTGLDPTQLAFDPATSRVFVANSGDDTVSVFDVSPRFVLWAYEGDNGENVDYNAIDVNPATGNIYTLRLGNLFAINEAAAAAGYDQGNPQNSAGVTTIPLGSVYSEAVVANPASNKIYVGDGLGLFYSINGATNAATELTILPSSASIRSLAVNSAANQILAWDYSSGNLFVLDSGTDTLLKTVVLSQSSQAFVLADPTKDRAYVAGDNFYAIDPTGGTVLATIPLGGVATAAAINPALSRSYVATNGEVYVINTITNTVIDNISLPVSATAIATNPVTGNYYVGFVAAGDVAHVQIYSGTSNTLIADLSSSTYPELGNVSDIKVNPLTDTIYVGTDSGASSKGISAIDGLTNAVSAVTVDPYEDAAHALRVDLGTNALAGAGYSYTTIWDPTSDITAAQSVPISVAIQGVPDSSTIATTPLFRTTSTKPTFKISATSNFPANAAALVAKHGFCQLDGWQGTWTAISLSAKAGSSTSQVTVKVPIALTTGQHILYCYASTGDVATVQDGVSGTNTPTISPIGFVVFTVEK